MEIVKSGINPNVKYPVQCRKCKAQFIAEQKDGRFVHDKRDGDCLVFECTVCGNEMWVNYEALKRRQQY